MPHPYELMAARQDWLDCGRLLDQTGALRGIIDLRLRLAGHESRPKAAAGGSISYGSLDAPASLTTEGGRRTDGTRGVLIPDLILWQSTE